MKHGCMVMTMRLSISRRSGSRQIHRSRKKRVKFVAMSSPCWSFFFFPTSRALSTRNSYPQVKSSMASFTLRFWSGQRRAFGANVQTSGRTTIGFSTMTTRPLTHHSLFDNAWLPKTLYWFPLPPYSPDSAPCYFFLFASMKLRLKGRRFDTTEEIHTQSQEVIDTLTFENFQWCMKSWETRWDHCMHAQGDYFKGDGGN